MSSTHLKIVDFLLLQAGWAVCVFGAAGGLWWAGPTFVAAALLARSRLADRPLRDLATAAAIGVLGVVADTVLTSTGVVAFPDGPRVGVLPLWIVALWPLFGSGFHSVLGWMHRRPVLAAVLGAVGGPPGYFAAERLGALQLPGSGPATFAALALAWGLVLPLGLAVARRMGVRRDAFAIAWDDAWDDAPEGRSSEYPCRAPAVRPLSEFYGHGAHR